jgi:type I restriction enzyme S subunit
MTTEARVVPLGLVCEIFDGPHATPKKAASGPIFLGISNLNDGRLDLSIAEHVSETDFAAWTRRVMPAAGDIVFSYETRLGQAAIIPTGLRCCLGRRMGLLRPDRRAVSPRFLLYAYLSPAFQETIRSRTVHGSTVDRIPLVEMAEFPIVVPPRYEQDRIAEILGALDDKIEVNRRMNETLEAIARCIFQEWLARHADAEVVRASVLISERILAIGDGYRAKNAEMAEDGLPFARAADVAGTPRITGEIEHLSPESVAKAGEKISRVGDVVITTKGTVGRIARVAPTTPRFVYSPQLCYWRSLDEVQLNPAVLFMWIGSADFREQLDSVSGQTDMAPYVSLSDQRNFRVPRFSAPEQRDIAAKLQPLLDRQALNDAESQTLAELRDTLLPKLLSGELRVREAEEVVAEATAGATV